MARSAPPTWQLLLCCSQLGPPHFLPDLLRESPSSHSPDSLSPSRRRPHRYFLATSALQLLPFLLEGYGVLARHTESRLSDKAGRRGLVLCSLPPVSLHRLLPAVLLPYTFGMAGSHAPLNYCSALLPPAASLPLECTLGGFAVQPNVAGKRLPVSHAARLHCDSSYCSQGC
ncbi:hypothetical protein AAT19DRAFT_10987 [Rhodotorula toruloides]|uniref:Uncharacterized protein n=1 Tax=Rhodotorula toruloides TaxID=5286 RepID=A0A2S9ZYK0_RHOTO|nr:hypothetical protein AAT19DRAFT_10987 [Rhodotorula toruloides]